MSATAAYKRATKEDTIIGPHGFPILTQSTLLALLEHIPPGQLASLFLLPYEEVLLLTGIDFDYWFAGRGEQAGITAFMHADPDSGLPDGMVLCLPLTEEEASAAEDPIGNPPCPVTVLCRGQYADE